jgi:uncharacterized protein
MGTIHINDKDVINIAHKAAPLISKCQAYLGEMDLGLVNPHEAAEAMKIKNEAFMLDQYLKPKEINKIKIVLKKYFNLDFIYYKDFYPLIAQNLILKTKLDNDHDKGMDQELYQIAIAKNKEMGGLETPNEQFQLLERLAIDEQWRLFKKFIRQPNENVKKLHQLKKYYIEGATHLLYRSVSRSLGIFRREMLYNRNMTMVDRLEVELKNKSVFASVGAAHLFGNKGIIALLKKKGFRVEKLEM